MKTGTPVAKPYTNKSYSYAFWGDDFAHPLRAMAQWVHRHPEAHVDAVSVKDQINGVLVLLTVTFPHA